MNISRKQIVAGVVLLVVGSIGGAAIALAANGGTNSDAEQAADVAKVKEVWNEYEASVNAEDSERWIALWIDDGIRMPPDEPRTVGLEQIRASVEPVFELFDFDEFTINPEEVRILGDRAYSHGLYGFSMTPKAGGDTIELSGKFLTILEKQADGSWKIAIDCFNYSPPE